MDTRLTILLGPQPPFSPEEEARMTMIRSLPWMTTKKLFGLDHMYISQVDKFCLNNNSLPTFRNRIKYNIWTTSSCKGTSLLKHPQTNKNAFSMQKIKVIALTSKIWIFIKITGELMTTYHLAFRFPPLHSNKIETSTLWRAIDPV